jgi:hypothetical protein
MEYDVLVCHLMFRDGTRIRVKILIR